MSNFPISKSRQWLTNFGTHIKATVNYADRTYTILTADDKPIREEQYAVARLAELNSIRAEIATWIDAELATLTPPTPTP
ncbi:hypothetical protein [Rhodoflexus caldus]|uniref:hypothetical protein n=1 Tax=Rhodoflexus caldus TaxID=2891236 RepID=UPI00202A5D39|nr:hypothetical protein [Rhodoflexus caldus]